MRSLIIFLILFCLNKSYSQTNRYSTLTPSTYTPSSNYTPSPNVDYYKAIAENRIESIKNNILYYDNLVQDALNSNIDQIFRENLWEINQYLNALKNASSMSLDNAESYIKIINRKYNKAVRKYNKRIKKANKDKR